MALVLLGPAWPSQATSLMCGDSVEATVETNVFPNMDTCAAEMARATESGAHCSCRVQENRFAPAYYLAVVPLVFVAATSMLSATTARGMAAVIIVLATTLLIPGPLAGYLHGAGIRVPMLLAVMAVGWFQFVLFGPTIFWAEPLSGLVLPYRWALLTTLAFWLVAALLFGLLARRVSSPTLLVAGAVCFVFGTALAVRVIAPIFNWQLLME